MWCTAAAGVPGTARQAKKLESKWHKKWTLDYALGWPGSAGLPRAKPDEPPSAPVPKGEVCLRGTLLTPILAAGWAAPAASGRKAAAAVRLKLSPVPGVRCQEGPATRSVAAWDASAPAAGRELATAPVETGERTG